MNYLYIGVAGGLGAICRYIIGIYLAPQSTFPFSTLLVNWIGCFVLAFILSRTERFSLKLRLALGTGFLGSFTTFSAFSMETIQLIEQAHILLAMLYLASSIIGCILLTNLAWKKEVDE